MKSSLPLLISLLALSAGCAAPPGDSEPRAKAADPATPDESAGGSAPPAETHAENGQLPGPADPPMQQPEPPAQASAGPVAPSWWSEAPVRQGDQVSVCAEATAPTLREARQQAIRAAYDRLEAELGEPPANASIGSDYAATQDGDVWRFRVRLTGSE